MFGISGGEIVVILLLVVMLFGANKIPELAKGFGKGMRDIRNAANDIKQEISATADEDETLSKFKEKVEKEKKEIEDITGSVKRNLDL
jgi:sec-independent protein translocase protein TatA